MKIKQAASISVLLASCLTGCYRGSRPAGINHPAPDFTVTDSDRSVSLHDLKGKVVLLNFWATWCPPCIQEMPSLVSMQQKLKGQVTVLAISIDVDEDAYHKFLKDYNVALLTVRDPDQKFSRLYGTFGWPETYVIDRDGKIRRKFIGPVNWSDPEVQQYLTSLAAPTAG
jgi:cytochrome c biogenesis protein CcmG, thiol:disulfide interchange protein DsbE